MAFDHSKFLARFVEEAREHCSRISAGLLLLEKSPGDTEILNNLFRSAHTMKGSSRMMKLAGVNALTHRMEDVLDAVRGGAVPFTVPVSDSLFRGVDALSAMLDRITAGEASPEAPEELCQELACAATVLAPSLPAVPVVPMAAAPPVSPSPSPPPPALPAPDHPASAEPVPAAPAVQSRQVDYLSISAPKVDELVRLMGEIVSGQGRFRRDISSLRELERALARHTNLVAERLTVAGGDAGLMEAGAALQQALRQAVRTLYDESLLQDHLVGDLQESSLRIRMQPLSTAFEPLRRTVRDLAREQGKGINFVVEGGDTELDRKIIDRIGDSLMHMIRNSLDHGVGTAEERVAAGKPPEGTIVLSACYDRGCVALSLSDDGRGISLDKIREKALARHLYDEEALSVMGRGEIINLIFLPGFSTSPIITDLSGRGVGMDVVRKSIVDELKGSIAVETREGTGTTFLMRLPLNLASFPLFLVRTSGWNCALPAMSIVEMILVQRDEIIDIVNKRAVRLREQILPVEDLSAILRMPSRSRQSDQILIVMVRDGEEKLGLIVDEIIGQEEMVVKPLPEHLRNLHLVSGVTIGERNSIIAVLHIPELFKQARENAAPARRHSPLKEDRAARILVVDDSINTREIEKSILEAYGYLVDTAEDGEEAWGMTRTVLYDLIVTDVEMPRLDGFSLTERVRNDERYGKVPVIIVTSRETEEDKKRGILVGANAYIVKGAFDQSVLMETVRSLVG